MKIRILWAPQNQYLQQWISMGLTPDSVHSVIRPPITLRGFVPNDLPNCYFNNSLTPTIPDGWWLSDANHLKYTSNGPKEDIIEYQAADEDHTVKYLSEYIDFHHGNPTDGWWIWAQNPTTGEYYTRQFVNSYGQVVTTKIPLFIPEYITISGTSTTFHLAQEEPQTEVARAQYSTSYDCITGLCHGQPAGTLSNAMPDISGQPRQNVWLWYRWSYLN